MSNKNQSGRWSREHARRLLSRAGFGGTPQEITRLTALGQDAAIEHLLGGGEERTTPPEWVREPWVDTEARLPELSREEQSKRHVSTRLRYRNELEGLKLWWLDRMVRTQQPLVEKMTLFWHWHFPTAHAKVFTSQAHYQQNALYRRYALGSFRRLAHEVTRDPAMMLYLDSHTNHREQPNENYARELMELFTMGIGNYTEADVKEAARALSGWTLDGLTPKFDLQAHDAGRKTLFGKSGALDAADVVDLCVQHPATAPRLCGKLVRFFGAADPDGALARRLATTLRESDFELRPVLRALLKAPELYADGGQATQIKCPIQLLVGTLRLLPVEGALTRPFSQALAQMGQDPFNPPNVKGWLTGREMVTTSTLMARYHLAEMVLEGRLPAGFSPGAPERQRVIRPDEAAMRPAAVTGLLGDAAEAASQAQRVAVRFIPERLFPAPPRTAESAAMEVCDRLLAGPPSPQLRRAVADAYQAAPDSQRAAVAVRLILTSPEYQLA